jgi:hypothetical protein
MYSLSRLTLEVRCSKFTLTVAHNASVETAKSTGETLPDRFEVTAVG